MTSLLRSPRILAASGAVLAASGAALLLLAGSCAVGPAPQTGDDPAAAPPPPTKGEVIGAIRRGDLAQAYEDLGHLLYDASMAEGRALLAEGSAEDALLAIDQALSLRPWSPETIGLKARGSLMLAESGIARGASAGLIEGAIADARDYYARATPGPGASLGASRAALLAGATDEALEHARKARAAFDEIRAAASEEGAAEIPLYDPALDPAPERVLAEALFRAYVAARGGEDAAAAALFDESEEALGRLAGRESNDPWVWGTLADLYEWEERYDDALATIDSGLARTPESVVLYERLVRVCGKAGGSQLLLETLDARVAAEPDMALPLWYRGVGRFDAATDALNTRFDAQRTGSDETADETAEEAVAEPPMDAGALVAAYRAAEADFGACRERDATLETASKGYEVMCRAGIGWTHYQEEELEEAVAAFQSMSDLFERGLEWKIEGRLLSGIDGLNYVGTKYNDRGDWLSAAETYLALHEAQPDEAVWANNAGFFFRDAGVEMELIGQALCRAAHGTVEDAEDLEAMRAAIELDPAVRGTPAEAQAFAEAANGAFADARSAMEESRAAYLAAAELAPEDVRVVNDTALVLVYYLHTDLQLAERLLERCVEMGAEQIQDEDLDEDARWELENAWGDAYQNLGVYHANLRDDPETARTYFERAIEIGPDPRPLLTDFWLPYLAGELGDGPELERVAQKTWAEPCIPADEG